MLNIKGYTPARASELTQIHQPFFTSASIAYDQLVTVPSHMCVAINQIWLITSNTAWTESSSRRLKPGWLALINMRQAEALSFISRQRYSSHTAWPVRRELTRSETTEPCIRERIKAARWIIAVTWACHKVSAGWWREALVGKSDDRGDQEQQTAKTFWERLPSPALAAGAVVAPGGQRCASFEVQGQRLDYFLCAKSRKPYPWRATLRWGPKSMWPNAVSTPAQYHNLPRATIRVGRGVSLFSNDIRLRTSIYLWLDS